MAIAGMTTVRPARIPQSKRYEYIKKIEVDGYPRLRAYAEVIDPKVYDLTPMEMHSRIAYLKKAWPDYEELREMVLAEQAEWNMRRSSVAQDKAMELLNCTLDKAIELVKDPESDTKAFSAAVNTLRTIMPALTSVTQKDSVEKPSATRNAAQFIN